MSATRLSRRSHQENLAAFSEGAEPAFVDLLRAEAQAGTWRIVEAYAERGPFELHAEWSGGDGRGQHVRLTVARATRFAVLAATLNLKVANLTGLDNRVGCNVSDGYCVSANQFEVRGVGTDAELPVSVPPFAHRVRLEIADPDQLFNSFLSVHDGVGQLRSRLSVSLQPPEGLPLGGAGSLKVLVPDGLRYRVVYFLSI